MSVKVEELKKMIAEMKEYLEAKNKESAEYKAKIEELSKLLDTKVSEVKKEVEERLATRKTPAVGAYETKDVRSLISMPAYDEKIKSVHKVADELQIVCDLLGASAAKRVADIYEKKYPFEMSVIKAGMGEGVTGGGAEWVPTGYSASMFEEIMLATQVAGLHDKIEMPQNPYTFPVQYADSQAYLVGETTDDTTTSPSITGTKPTTANFTLNAKKLGARIRFSEELNEDSIVPVLPRLRKSIVNAIARGIENAIINGGFTDDADLTAGTSDPRNAFDGYRKLAIASAKVDAGGDLTAEDILAVRAVMGKYGVFPKDLAAIVSAEVYLKDLLGLKDNNGRTVVTTVDKYGPNATILTGEVGKVYGIPIVVSEFVRNDLNNVGVADGSTAATLSEIILTHRPSFIVGYRRNLKLKVGQLIEQDQQVIVGTVRIAFGTPWTDRPVVGILYDVAY